MAFGTVFNDDNPAARTLGVAVMVLLIVCGFLVAALALCAQEPTVRNVSTPTCGAQEFAVRGDTTWYEVRCVGKKLEGVR